MLKASALLLLLVTSKVFAQSWTNIAPVPSAGRDDGIAFSLNNLGFIVTGTSDGSDYSESNRLFCYDPDIDYWTEKAVFPGIKRQYASSFVIEDLAYIIGGYSEQGTALNDVWSYDAELDLWSELDSFPGIPRWDAGSCSLEDRGFLALGTSVDSTLSDIWEYNPEKDHWNKVCYYPGGDLRSIQVFPLVDKLIFGQGFSVDPIVYSENWFSFNPTSEIWTPLDSPIATRAYGTVISNGVSAIVCGGMDDAGVYYNDSYLLDYAGKWKSLGAFGSLGLRGSSGFVIENSFYIGTGLESSGTKTSTFYRTSILTTEIHETVVFPNPFSEYLNIVSSAEANVELFDLSGKCATRYKTDDAGYLKLENLDSGLYLLRISDGREYVTVKIIHCHM